MSTAAQKKQDQHESNVVEKMKTARQIAQKYLGERADTAAVHEVFDYIAEADSDGEEEFVFDFTRMIEHAKDVYETTAPTSEQVFGLLDRYLNAE